MVMKIVIVTAVHCNRTSDTTHTGAEEPHVRLVQALSIPHVQTTELSSAKKPGSGRTDVQSTL